MVKNSGNLSEQGYNGSKKTMTMQSYYAKSGTVHEHNDNVIRQETYFEYIWL